MGIRPMLMRNAHFYNQDDYLNHVWDCLPFYSKMHITSTFVFVKCNLNVVLVYGSQLFAVQQQDCVVISST